MGSHEEIVMDILSRLPVKSLLRFKCVSKFWNKLISEPYFKRMHLNVHTNNHNSPKKLLISQVISLPTYYIRSSAIGDRRVYRLSKTIFNFYSFSLSNSGPQLVKDIRKLDSLSSFKPRSGCVYCCCDGLCFIGIWRERDNTQHPSISLLWNPSTGESIKLPTQYPESSPDKYLYGLGYDSTSDDYKIIRIDAFDGVCDYGLPDEILAIKSASWKKTSQCAGGPCGILARISELYLAFVEGAFHWESGHVYPSCVVTFNISNETYGNMSLPVRPYSNTSEETGVSAVGGRLCYHHDDGINFNLWVMKDYGMKESWTKWFSIPNHMKCYITPIYRFSNDEVLLSCLYEKADYEFVYKTANGSSNLMWPQHSNDIMHPKTIMDGFVYTESLISPRLDAL
ncbi:F-box/kelch-repeat protein like [Capsicum chacoense]